MKIVKIGIHLTTEEKETVLSYSQCEKCWRLDTTIMKHYNKCIKQGWQQISKYVYDDGTVCGGLFCAPHRAITIRDVDKKQMSEKQMHNLDNDIE